MGIVHLILSANGRAVKIITFLCTYCLQDSFLDHTEEETVAPVTMFDLGTEVKADQKSLKRSFAEVEDTSSDLGKLSVRVGLNRTASNDHDYSSKRPRMSPTTEVSSVEKVEEVFLPPAPSPAPSTSYTNEEPTEDKYRHRREKNNIASKRSREIRKKKFVDMEQEAERLISENARLELRVVELEELAKKMKEILVAKMAGK